MRSLLITILLSCTIITSPSGGYGYRFVRNACGAESAPSLSHNKNLKAGNAPIDTYASHSSSNTRASQSLPEQNSTMHPLNEGIGSSDHRSSPESKENSEKEDPTNIVKVGAYENHPKIFTDGQGRVIGIFPDILSYIAGKEGWKIDYVHGDWEESLKRLESGSIDLMVDVGFSPERASRYLFSDEAVFLNWGAIYTAGEFRADSFLDLKGRRIAVMKGSIHTDGEHGIKNLLKQFDIECQFVEADNYGAVFDLLTSGKADAGVVNRIFGTLNETGGLHASPIVFNPTQLKFAFPPGKDKSNALKERIDFHLRALKSERNGFYNEVISHYLEGLPGGVSEDLNGKDSSIHLSFEERKWLEEHPVIKIGVDPGFAPFEFISDHGIYMGMAADYMTLIAESIGVEFRVVNGLSWNDTVEKAKKGDIDLLPCVGISEERKRYFIYSDPYLSFSRVIVTRNPSDIGSIDDLKERNVAVQVNSSHHEFLKSFPEIKISLYSTFQDAMLALSRGSADAVIGNSAVAIYTIKTMNFANLRIAGEISDKPSSLAFAVRKDWPILVNIINRSLYAISDRKKAEIRTRWAPGELPETMTSDVLSTLALSLNEQEFLKNHRLLRIGVNPSLPPFEWIDEQGRYQGISSDYIELIKRRLGIEIAVVSGITWKEVEERLKDRSIDMVPCQIESSSRTGYLSFTRPYLSYPVVVVTRQNSPFVGDMGNLSGRRVGVVSGYFYSEFIEKNYPGIELRESDTVLKCLNELVTGVTDAHIGNLAAASYLMQKYNITNLKISAPAEGAANSNLAMGVRSDWPEMVSILDKALKSVTPMEKNSIASRWMSVRFEHSIDWSRVVKLSMALGSAAALIIGLILFWNRKLAMEIQFRKRAEDDLISARDEADRARREAERANMAKSLFLANMSHEIRTPMNAILGYSRLMQMDSSLSEDHRKSVVTISRSGEHLLNLINDILEMSKIEAGKIEIADAAFDLHFFLEDMRLLFSERVKSKGIDLRFVVASDESHIIADIENVEIADVEHVESTSTALEAGFRYDAVPRYIAADENKLRQIVINLIGNALKFTDYGYIRLTVNQADSLRDVKDPLLREKYLDAERHYSDDSKAEIDRVRLSFTVTDTGVGIPEESHLSVFQSFEQTELGRTKEGTGLGLAICRKYAELMGGSLELVDSSPGEGSSFRLTIPVARVNESDVPVKPSGKRVIGFRNSGSAWRILVVDDKVTNREILSRLLISAGISVKEACNGKEALEIFESWKPHMVMMDIRMPVMDGVEATKRIKSGEAGGNTVVIVVSASAMEEQRIEVMSSGADAFIKKPFRESEIFDAIENYLEAEPIYESDLDENGYSNGIEIKEALSHEKSIAALPSSLRKEMMNAVEGGYIDILKERLEKVAEIDHDLSGYLQELADKYEYDELMRLLET